MELFDQPQNNQCVTIIVLRALSRAPSVLGRTIGADLKTIEGIVGHDVYSTLTVRRERLGIRLIRVRSRDIPDVGDVDAPGCGIDIAHVPLLGDEPEVPRAV